MNKPKADFTENFGPSKIAAEKAIQECLSGIERELTQSVVSLRQAGQWMAFDPGPVSVALKEAKTEWLNHMSCVFNQAILHIEGKLALIKSPDC